MVLIFIKAFMDWNLSKELQLNKAFEVNYKVVNCIKC